jgi:hypothetical protein
MNGLFRVQAARNRTLVVTVTCALAMLTSCAQGNSAANLQPEAAPSPQASAQTPPAQSPPVRQAAMTPEKIKADCWMKYEGDRKIKNIDERLKLVEKCVDETSRNQPPSR